MKGQGLVSEELIFDYLEGNLDQQEKEAFELLMSENETLAFEVKLWGKAYFTEALPHVNDLEKKLLKKTSRTFSHFFSTISIISLILL